MDSRILQNLEIVTNKNCFLRFVNIYWKTILFLVTPLILLPVASIGVNNAYKSFYIFLVMAVYWVTNVFHPGITSLIPIALFTIFGAFDKQLMNVINIGNSVLDCLGVMMMIIAIEQSNIHKRIAIKILLIFGCSHFRLSFLLFFSTTILSMWFTNTMACGLVTPVVKAVLNELEKMGILETHEITLKSDDETIQRPTDFTVFYFLGIAYSSSIGGMTKIAGSETNQIFMNYCATLFPQGPQLEVPDYMLLSLPGMLILEMSLYLWMNFYFLGMLRVHNYTTLQASLTGEEEQYFNILLDTEYVQLGNMKFQEMLVSGIVILTAILQAFTNNTNMKDHDQINSARVLTSSAPSIISILVLFVIPSQFDCFKFFRRSNGTLPTAASKGFITWSTIKNNLHWSVLFVIASSNITLEALKYNKMTDEFERFLFIFSNAPAPLMALLVILLCKILTEFASDPAVVYCILPHVARVSVKSKINPLYLMLSATLSSSLPFHLITGSPGLAMVAAYVNIPHRKLIIAGIGPSIIAVLTNLFTVCFWSKIIWPDIDTFPEWAVINLKDK